MADAAPMDVDQEETIAVIKWILERPDETVTQKAREIASHLSVQKKPKQQDFLPAEPRVALNDLPFDVFDIIFAQLDAQSILAVGLTTKVLGAQLMHHPKFWWRALQGSKALNYRTTGYFYDLPPTYLSRTCYDDWDEIVDTRSGEIYDPPLVYGIGVFQKQLLNSTTTERIIMAQTGLPDEPRGDQYMIAAFPNGVEEPKSEEYVADTNWKELFFEKWREYLNAIVSSRAICPFESTAIVNSMCYCDLKEHLWLNKKVDLDFMRKSFFAMDDTMQTTPLYDASDEDWDDIYHFRSLASALASGDAEEEGTEIAPEALQAVVTALVDAIGSTSFVPIFGLCLSALEVEHLPHVNCADWVTVRTFRLKYGEVTLPLEALEDSVLQVRYAKALWERRCKAPPTVKGETPMLTPEEMAQFASFDSVVSPNGLGAMAIRTLLCALHKYTAVQLAAIRKTFGDRFPAVSGSIDVAIAGDAIPDVRCGLAHPDPWIHHFFSSRMPTRILQNTLNQEYIQESTLDEDPAFDNLTWHRTFHQLFRRAGIMEAAPGSCEEAYEILSDYLHDCLKGAIRSSLERANRMSVADKTLPKTLPKQVTINENDVFIALAGDRAGGPQIIYGEQLYDIPSARLFQTSYVDREESTCSSSEHSDVEEDSDLDDYAGVEIPLQTEIEKATREVRSQHGRLKEDVSPLRPSKLTKWQQKDASEVADDGTPNEDIHSSQEESSEDFSPEMDLMKSVDEMGSPNLEPNPPLVWNEWTDLTLREELIYLGYGAEVAAIPPTQPILEFIRSHDLSGEKEETHPDFHFRADIKTAVDKILRNEQRAEGPRMARRLVGHTEDPFAEFDQVLESVTQNSFPDMHHLVVYPGISEASSSRALSAVAKALAHSYHVTKLTIISSETHTPKSFKAVAEVLAKPAATTDLVLDSCVLSGEDIKALGDVLASPKTSMSSILLHNCCLGDTARAAMHDLKQDPVLAKGFSLLHLPRSIEFSRRKKLV